MGFEEKKEKNSTKPLIGKFKKVKAPVLRHIKEVRNFPIENLKEGDVVKVDMFKEGDTVKVSGISKGKGFQGVVKRHGFAGGQRTHGQSDRQRAPGSIGGSSYPSRVFKGQRMAGRMGGDTVTVRNMRVVKIFSDSNLILIKGAVPGTKTGLVEIYKN
jgi:large subunit ribosomal protein L3